MALTHLVPRIINNPGNFFPVRIHHSMRRTFNLGVGIVAVVAAKRPEEALGCLNDAGEQAWVLGEVEAGAPDGRVVFDSE